MVRKLAISAILAISVVSSVQLANSEDAAPKGNKGFTASKTTVVDLGPEIEGLTGRQLRMRMLTIEPGGYIGVHSHADRPAVVYCLQGDDEVGLCRRQQENSCIPATRRRPLRIQLTIIATSARTTSS